jgi:lysophospholipase L1-like esterase
MKKILLSGLAFLFIGALTLALLEGIYSLAKTKKPHLSVTYQALTLLNLAGGNAGGAEGAYAEYFSDPANLSAMIPMMRDAGVGLGNTPFADTMTDEAAINAADGKCTGMKPNLRKSAFFLRTSAFNPFDPPTVFHDVDAKLDPVLQDFLDSYGKRRTSLTTNANGERSTIPAVDRPAKVLVAGDSIAFGAMVSDDETIASQMQARDGARQYINLGVAGIDAEAIICRLEQAAQRYKGAIDELVYVYCENDFKPSRPYGTPDQVIGWLKEFAAREGIAKVTVVFSPYIYLAAPEVTRFTGYIGATYPNHTAERAELARLTREAGFAWVDIGDLAREAIEQEKTQFGFFRLFVDHNHLSPEGTRRLVDRLAVQCNQRTPMPAPGKLP